MKNNNNLILFQIRRHLGELDWTLPLLFRLKKKGYKIITYFDKKKIFNDLAENKILYKEWKKINTDYYFDKNYAKLFNKFFLNFYLIIKKVSNFEIFSSKIVYSLKKNQYQINEIKNKYNFKNFRFFFISNNNYSNLYLNFMEHNQKLKIIRFPTSQWMRFFYKKKVEKNLNEKFYGDKYLVQSKNNAKDYFGSNFNRKNINKKIIYCGNTKYEAWWLKKIYTFSKKSIGKKTRVLIATRGWRLKPKKNFPKSSFYKIINEILNLNKTIKNIEFIFKTHPSKSELDYLKEILDSKQDINWQITNEQISSIIKDCNFAITLNTSACLDVVSMDKLCIEFWLNDEDNFTLMKDGRRYFTTYQKYGIVENVNSFKKLNKFVIQIKNNNYYKKIKKKQKKNFLKMNNLVKYNSNFVINKLEKI